MTGERDVYDGRRRLGTIRERGDGSFVAVIDEQVIGEFTSVKAASNKIIELARPGGGHG